MLQVRAVTRCSDGCLMDVMPRGGGPARMTGTQVHPGIPLSFGGVTTAQRARPGSGFTMGQQVAASV